MVEIKQAYYIKNVLDNVEKWEVLGIVNSQLMAITVEVFIDGNGIFHPKAIVNMNFVNEFHMALFAHMVKNNKGLTCEK